MKLSNLNPGYDPADFETGFVFWLRGHTFAMRFDLRDSLARTHRFLWRWVQHGLLDFGEGVQLCRQVEEKHWQFWTDFKI